MFSPVQSSVAIPPCNLQHIQQFKNETLKASGEPRNRNTKRQVPSFLMVNGQRASRFSKYPQECLFKLRLIRNEFVPGLRKSQQSWSSCWKRRCDYTGGLLWNLVHVVPWSMRYLSILEIPCSIPLPSLFFVPYSFLLTTVHQNSWALHLHNPLRLAPCGTWEKISIMIPSQLFWLFGCSMPPYPDRSLRVPLWDPGWPAMRS